MSGVAYGLARTPAANRVHPCAGYMDARLVRVAATMTVEVRVGTKTFIARRMRIGGEGLNGFPAHLCVGDAALVSIEGAMVKVHIGTTTHAGTLCIEALSWLDASRIGNALFEWAERCGADVEMVVTP